MPLAVRVYPESPDEPTKPDRRAWRRSRQMLVFDTETRTDATQRLTFGSYRFIAEGCCLEEGLFHADDLPPRDLAVLRRYARTHRANTDARGVRELRLLTRRAFLDKMYEIGFQARGLIVGFNLPFDLSRLAVEVSSARERFAGGFSLGLWEYRDRRRWRLNPHRPRIGIKHIDSKRAIIGFTGQRRPDRVDQIPEGSTTGAPDPRYVFRGHFLDLRRLAFALTDEGHTLDSACQAFGVEHGKQKAARHGTVTASYIDYNRRDVLATWELAAKLLTEYDAHPITMQVTKAYSSASMGKAYLRAMGIAPVLERQPDFPLRYLGYAQSAFYGGRTSAHIRKVLVPVVYTDFLSMYPTVNRLMRLWPLVTAKNIRVVKRCRTDVQSFLRAVTLDAMFNQDTWAELSVFVRIAPDGDILPTRGQYADTHDWQVAVNHVYGGPGSHRDALWYALPDAVASVLLTGRIPTIVDAFRIVPVGTANTLMATKLRGIVPVDPRRDDFFKVAIEERKRGANRLDLSPEDRGRLDRSLKVFANAASYGIYAEMNAQESDEETAVQCHGLDGAFRCRVVHPERAGEYCFPPLASLITSGARLMLATLERCVSDHHGTYAMEDTDSMAIVATERGGLVPCAGGPYRTVDDQPAVHALSWPQVRAVAKRFAALNPYDRDAIPGSILKIEDDNFDPGTKAQRQLYCYAISAKRYALFVHDQRGEPELLRKGVNGKTDGESQHGLGHLLNPSDPDSDDRNWIAQAWHGIVRRGHGLSTERLPFADLPAVGRISVSSPTLLRPFAGLNARKPYAGRVKPFNFGLTCFVRALGHPPGADPHRFHLFAPFELNPHRWRKGDWIDQHSGKEYRITTIGDCGNRRAARVKTYGDVLADYEDHPESKCADATGSVCTTQTIGLLQRRHVRIESITNIGKETNRLDDVESGLVHDPADVYTVYTDPSRDYWHRRVVPALRHMPLRRFERETGKSRRRLIDARRGRRRPQARHRAMFIALCQKWKLL